MFTLIITVFACTCVNKFSNGMNYSHQSVCELEDIIDDKIMLLCSVFSHRHKNLTTASRENKINVSLSLSELFARVDLLRTTSINKVKPSLALSTDVISESTKKLPFHSSQLSPATPGSKRHNHLTTSEMQTYLQDATNKPTTEMTKRHKFRKNVLSNNDSTHSINAEDDKTDLNGSSTYNLILKSFSSGISSSTYTNITKTSKFLNSTAPNVVYAFQEEMPVSKETSKQPYFNSIFQKKIKSISSSDNLQMSENISYVRFLDHYPVKQWMKHGLFTREYVFKINKHWLQFDPPGSSAHYVLAAIYIALCLTGMTGNILVIIMYITHKSLRTSANTLVVNLAISDFLLEAKIPIFVFNSVYEGPALGYIGCQAYGFLGGLTGVVSIMTLCAIAVDRYYVIVFPFQRAGNSRVKFSIFLSWTYGVVFASVPLTGLGFGQYVPEGYLTSCSFDYLTSDINIKYFIITFFIAAWVIPFCIIIYCYTKIYHTVVSRKMEINGESSKHCKDEENQKTEIRLAYVVLSVICLWFISWTPYAVVALLGIMGQHYLITPLSSMIPAIFCKTASCLDPFVYAMTHPRFREELFKTFRCQKAKKKMTSGKNVCPTRSTLSSNSSFEIEEVIIQVEGTNKKKIQKLF